MRKAYVDALGPEAPYQQYLSSVFPGIEFTVTKKADVKFKIVGAASVAAKVTRDACCEGWVYEEAHDNPQAQVGWAERIGSGYPSGKRRVIWTELYLLTTGRSKHQSLVGSFYRANVRFPLHSALLLGYSESNSGKERTRCQVVHLPFVLRSTISLIEFI